MFSFFRIVLISWEPEKFGKNGDFQEVQDQINQAAIVRVFQTPEIFQDLTILQNVMISTFSKRDGEYRFNAFTSMLSEKNVQQEAESILEDLNMESMLHHHAGSLSRGGQA